LNDKVAVGVVWNALGAAFYEAALYVDSRECFKRASALSKGDARLGHVYSAALTNVATCCLHIREYGEGIEKILEALAAMPSASSPVLLLARVFAEGTFTRLLLETGNVKEAAKRAQLAKGFAVDAKSVQADISAACSEGLVEVFSGLGDVGCRGMQALEKARVKPSLRETLLAMVQAHEKAGPDALLPPSELTLHIRSGTRTSFVIRNCISNSSRPMRSLNLVALLEEKDAELTQKIAAQTVGAKQGRLLEQMAFTAEMRDDPTGEHCYRVAKLASLLAQAHGESSQTCATIELAARLHDIGKVGIPDTLMQKATLLSDGERQILETHAKTGAELLARTKVSYGELAEDIARHHHERWDGHGYPDGIFGSAMPLATHRGLRCLRRDDARQGVSARCPATRHG
jgi:putative two-component system response regulator